jgi:hypothetical protein
MVADWLVRSADVLAAWPTARAVGRVARAERDMAWRSAAGVVQAHDWGTAGAVWGAIADATWGAAGSAARAVVWSTTDPAGPGTAEPPVWDAVSDAAADAAGALAWVAVREAARGVAAGPTGGEQLPDDDVWAMAWDTACAALASTSVALQGSAHDLVNRMLAITE